MMTNGFGASIGMLLAGEVVNHFTHGEVVNGEFYTVGDPLGGWSTCWYIFAGYALVVAILFAILFQYKHKRV